MSQVHRVINLREPFKIFSMTLHQIGFLAVGILIAFALGSRVPGDWKLGNIPAGLVLGIFVVCLAIVAGGFTELKPMVWWRNMLSYRLGLVPRLYIPKSEAGQIYPDPTIIERSDAEEFYVERETRPQN
ncbi:MAG: hypothetical protein SGJ27_10325 [Candidatus Melainabacteria bacterium]|nr:hypothetical protein [Candidatus Melainabacteria bacterium]